MKKEFPWTKKKSNVNAEGIDGYDWDESQPKWPMTRVLKYAFGIVSVIVWILVLWRIFSGSSGDFDKMILLDSSAAAVYPQNDQTVIRIYSENSETDAEAPIVEYAVYLDCAENLQLTLRINRRTFPEPTGKNEYRFVLRQTGESGEQYYNLSYSTADNSFQYRFYRLCFNGVPLSEDDVYTLLVFDGDFVSENEEAPYPASQSLFSYTVKNSDTYTTEITPKEREYLILEK